MYLSTKKGLCWKSVSSLSLRMCKVALQMSNWIQISTKQKNTIYFPPFVHRDHLVLHLAYPDGEGCAESLLLQQSPWISLDPMLRSGYTSSRPTEQTEPKLTWHSMLIASNDSFLDFYQPNGKSTGSIWTLGCHKRDFHVVTKEPFFIHHIAWPKPCNMLMRWFTALSYCWAVLLGRLSS